MSRERERSDAQGALADALPLWPSKPSQKGRAAFSSNSSVEVGRRRPPSVLVATHQAFEHSITDVLLRSLRRRAQFKQYKRLQRAVDFLAETDTQNLEALFRRPLAGILSLPTYAGANLRADRTLASTSKFSLPMQSHGRRAIFRALVTESRRALATRGRVGSAVWAAAVDEGYPTRGEVHKAGGGEVGGQSSALFLSLPRPSRSFPRPPSSTATADLAADCRPRRRPPTSPPPTYLLVDFVVVVCYRVSTFAAACPCSR